MSIPVPKRDLEKRTCHKGKIGKPNPIARPAKICLLSVYGSALGESVLKFLHAISLFFEDSW